MNVSSVSFSGALRPIENSIEEFTKILDNGDKERLTIDRTEDGAVRAFADLQKIERVEFIGDVAHYYLPYVEQMRSLSNDIRFICLKRDKKEVVRSWMDKTSYHRTPMQAARGGVKAALFGRTSFTGENRWQEHDGSLWRINAKWDKCFPKFEADTKEDAIGQYWEYYSETATKYQAQMPDQFRIFDMDQLNSSVGQNRILEFCGFDESLMVKENIHENRTTEIR